jgi:omega-6 fatty acid desaturase (delta-12 desaturase)
MKIGVTQKKSNKIFWKEMVTPYQVPEIKRSIWQLCNTVIPFLIVWFLMYLSLNVSYWLTLLLALPATGFLMRIFIIQHDCGHGSFFKSRKANDTVGSFCGVLTLTPYHYWKKSHAIHHANAGNLEHRGVGDVYTMTLDEYREKSAWGRFTYRIYRNPVFLFVFAPTFLFVVLYRFSHPKAKGWKKERDSVHLTNLAILAIALVLCYLIGWQAFLLIQAPITILAATMGTWFFYVQHQYEDTYWEHEGDWEYTEAALKGSSFYKLPKILQWFSGNIGFHHIHHLSPRIPNYKLEECHKENPVLQEVVELTLWDSLKTSLLTLWDEDQKKLISFKDYKRRQQMETAGI